MDFFCWVEVRAASWEKMRYFSRGSCISYSSVSLEQRQHIFCRFIFQNPFGTWFSSWLSTAGFPAPAWVLPTRYGEKPRSSWDRATRKRTGSSSATSAPRCAVAPPAMPQPWDMGQSSTYLAETGKPHTFPHLMGNISISTCQNATRMFVAGGTSLCPL